MSLVRHVCRPPLHVNAPKDHVWISEDVLNHAMHRFAHGKVPRRHVGLAPGPLEAGKRASKRRMMNLAQEGGGGGFDPSVLPGLGAPESVEWKWQSPRSPTPQRADGVAPLLSWLTALPPTEANKCLNKPAKEKHIKAAEEREDFGEHYADLGRKHPLANPAVWEDFQNCKDVAGLYNWAARHDIDVRRYPKLLFTRLCHAGQSLPVLLHALDDVVLGSRSLTFLLDWLLRKRKGQGGLQKRVNLDDMALLQQWMKRQLHLGLRSEEDILAFLRFISRVSDATSDESLRCNLVASFEGLQSSSVFGIKNLGTEVQYKILELMTRGPMTSQMLELGFSLVENVPNLQLEGTDQKISAFIEKVIHAHTSRQGYQERGTLSLEVMPTVLEKIRELPLELAYSVTFTTTKALFNNSLRMPGTEAAMTQLRDTWLSALAMRRGFSQGSILKTRIESFLGPQRPELVIPYLQQLDEREKASFALRYWVGPQSQEGQSRAQYLFREYCSAKRKDSPWVSMLQAAQKCAEESLQPSDTNIRRVFKTLQLLRQSETIVEILKQARKLDAFIDESDVVYIISEHLGEQSHLAERMFRFYPKLLRLEKCPELAERIIQNPRVPLDTALRYMRRHCPRFHIYRDHLSREQFSQPRIELLGRMALAYSMTPHITPKMAYSNVYECYTQHMKERLGPVSTEMTRGFTQAGLIRPLQAGEWVNTTKVRWILSLIQSAEGAYVADRVDEVVYKLRGANAKLSRGSSSFGG